MPAPDFHRRFLDSLRQRDWQLGALVVVPLACYLVAEAAGLLAPERGFKERCLAEVRTAVTDRLFGAMVYDIGRPELTDLDGAEATVEIDITANAVPLRAAYRCTAGAADRVAVRRLWIRRV